MTLPEHTHPILWVTFLGLAAANMCGAESIATRAMSPMAHDAYVWQRAWTEAVTDAVRAHGSNFSELIALNAEVSWKNRQPQVIRVTPDAGALRSFCRGVGLALRVGPYPGPFTENDHAAAFLGDLAASLAVEAATNKLSVSELQIDFDCAEAKLDGFAVWLRMIRRRVAPLPVTITALPSWLDQPAFKGLIGVADGYVLQVHSLVRPAGPKLSFKLCDPVAAQRAVEKAALLEKPFRVALPAYGYQLGFDKTGRFIGLSAEAASPSWPEGAQLREARADPEEIASLVEHWNRDRPRALTGVIWYRLPVAGDKLHWRWPTLMAVMSGITPHSELRAEIRKPSAGLVEIELANLGSADCSPVPEVTLRWQQGRVLAADALQGFDCLQALPNTIQFNNRVPGQRLNAGEKARIGWVRFDKETEVQLEISRSQNKR